MIHSRTIHAMCGLFATAILLLAQPPAPPAPPVAPVPPAPQALAAPAVPAVPPVPPAPAEPFDWLSDRMADLNERLAEMQFRFPGMEWPGSAPKFFDLDDKLATVQENLMK